MFAEIISTAASTVAIAAFGYVYNLGTRVTVLETKAPDTKEIIEGKFDLVFSKLDEVNRRLGRVEVAMNGAIKHA